MGEGVEAEPDWATDWDGAAQPAPAPDLDVGQRVNGRQAKAAALTRYGQGCVCGRPNIAWRARVSPITWFSGSNSRERRRFDAPNPCHTSPHAVEFPIPYGTTAAPYARVSGQTATRDGYGYWFADKGTTCALKTNDLKALTNLSTSF